MINLPYYCHFVLLRVSKYLSSLGNKGNLSLESIHIRESNGLQRESLRLGS